MSSPPSISLEESAAERVKHEQDRLRDDVRSLFQQTPASIVGNLVGVLILITLFWGMAPVKAFMSWCVPFAALMGTRWVLYKRFARADEQGLEALLAWRKTWNLLTVVTGMFWGLAVWVFYPYGGTLQQVGLVLNVYGYTLGSIQLLANQTRVFLAFAGASLLPTSARLAYGQGMAGIELGLLILLFFAMSALMARNYKKVYDNLVDLKIRTELLADQLRRQMLVAEAARQDAEVANRAKTQFFAAASHDLRQPLHAMGLFAEALRNKSRDEEVIKLVNSINSSVDALEGLFSELLDITKIDTGAVDVVPQNFGMREMFARLRLHYEPTAFEKGLQLKLHGEQWFAYADPVLVERILRNLISNAIRYTEDGGVLVSCRQRGDKLMLQVWDSGAGIAESEQARIFEEFYQVQPDQPLPAHHRKGLGLGLAIVRRLADLMGTPLSLRSRLGHGTVFTLMVPMGRAVRPSEASVSKAPLGITLDRKLIVVVEDEPAVRDGLEVMLKGWGATVAAFDSVAASQGWAEQASQQGLLPDLLIVDYRIDHRTTGIDAIRALRERFGKALPAIVVTGSTTVSLEEEAHEHDFHLLIKPVVPNKLRAMIAFKLGVRGR